METNSVSRSKKLPPPPLCLPATNTTTDEENNLNSNLQRERKKSANSCCLSSSSSEDCSHQTVSYVCSKTKKITIKFKKFIFYIRLCLLVNVHKFLKH